MQNKFYESVMMVDVAPPPYKISIILPTYNVEPFITDALKSCIKQSYKNIEILVIDDCGSDGSIQVAQKFASQDNRIKIIHNPYNLNLFKTREVGAKNASGEYILFLDPDDMLDLDTCKIFVERLEMYGELDFIGCNMVEYHNSMKFLARTSYARSTIYEDLWDYLQYFKKKSLYWNLCGNLLKRDKYLLAHQKLKDCPSFMMAEDALLFFYYFTCVQSRIAVVHYYLYYYRIHQTSSTNTVKTQNKAKAWQYIQEHNIAIEYIQNFIFSSNRLDCKLLGRKICKALKSAKFNQKILYWQNHACFPLKELAFVLEFFITLRSSTMAFIFRILSAVKRHCISFGKKFLERMPNEK